MGTLKCSNYVVTTFRKQTQNLKNLMPREAIYPVKCNCCDRILKDRFDAYNHKRSKETKLTKEVMSNVAKKQKTEIDTTEQLLKSINSGVVSVKRGEKNVTRVVNSIQDSTLVTELKATREGKETLRASVLKIRQDWEDAAKETREPAEELFLEHTDDDLSLYWNSLPDTTVWTDEFLNLELENLQKKMIFVKWEILKRKRATKDDIIRQLAHHVTEVSNIAVSQDIPDIDLEDGSI